MSFAFPGNMFLSEPSVSGFTPHQLALAAMAGQPANGQGIPIERFISGIADPNTNNNSVIPSSWLPTYVRQFQNPNPSPSMLPGSSIYPAPGPMEYAFQQPVDSAMAGRQFANAALPPSYSLQQFQQSGSGSQSITLPHSSIPYGASLPFLSCPIAPAMCNGGPNHVPQYATVHPAHAQAALVASASAAPVRTYDSLKHFGALPLIQQNRRSKPTITSKTNLYISGLSESDTDETVRSLVDNVVQPKSCKAMVKNGKCQGYGFIDCASEEDADKAKNHITESAKVSGGRKLSVTFAYENEKDLLNVYVQHLPRRNFTKEDLEFLFLEYGHITSVKLMETEAGLTGCGFVRFACAEDAKRAMDKMNDRRVFLGDNDCPVSCKLADKADTRRRTLAATHAMGAAMLQPPPGQPQQSALGPNPLHRQNLPACCHSSSLPPGSMLPSQAQQPLSPYGQSVPLATQLLPPMQPQLAVPGMPSLGASPHSRAAFGSSVLPNGASGPSAAMVPMPFPSMMLNAINSHRSTPLIGPPPHPQLPALGLQAQNSNLVAAYAAAMDPGQGCAKPVVTAGSSTATYANVNLGSLYVPNGTTLGSPPVLNNSQSLIHLNPIPSNIPYIPHYGQQRQITVPTGATAAVNANRSPLMLLSMPSVTYTDQSALISTFLSVCARSSTASPNTSPSQSVSLPKYSGTVPAQQQTTLIYPQPCAVYKVSQENSNVSGANCDNPNAVNLVTSEFQALSFNCTTSIGSECPVKAQVIEAESWRSSSIVDNSKPDEEIESTSDTPTTTMSTVISATTTPTIVDFDATSFQPAAGQTILNTIEDPQFLVRDHNCMKLSIPPTSYDGPTDELEVSNITVDQLGTSVPTAPSAAVTSGNSVSPVPNKPLVVSSVNLLSVENSAAVEHNGRSTPADQRNAECLWTNKYTRMVRKKHDSPSSSSTNRGGRRRSESGLTDSRSPLGSGHMHPTRRRPLVTHKPARLLEPVNGTEIPSSSSRVRDDNLDSSKPNTPTSNPAK